MLWLNWGQFLLYGFYFLKWKAKLPFAESERRYTQIGGFYKSGKGGKMYNKTCMKLESTRDK